MWLGVRFADLGLGFVWYALGVRVAVWSLVYGFVDIVWFCLGVVSVYGFIVIRWF